MPNVKTIHNCPDCGCKGVLCSIKATGHPRMFYMACTNPRCAKITTENQSITEVVKQFKSKRRK